MKFSLRCALVLAAACQWLAGWAPAMTLLVGSTDLEPGRVTAVADAAGQLVRSGSGFVAVGAFGDLDEATIRAAAGTGAAMQELLGRFQQLGASHRFGLGSGLERIDGAFQANVSARTSAGDGLVGRPVYVVGGNESGIFIFRSQVTFEADHPVAHGSVDLWGDSQALAGGLLVGEVGESMEVLELGPSGSSLRLAPVAGGGLDLSRFEANQVPPDVPPPTIAPPVSIDAPLPGIADIPVRSAPDPIVPGETAPAVETPELGLPEDLVLVDGRLGTIYLDWESPGMAGNDEWIRWTERHPGPESFLIGDFWNQSVSFTTLGLTAQSLSRASASTPAVPEPRSFLLLLVGSLLLVRRSRGYVQGNESTGRYQDRYVR